MRIFIPEPSRESSWVWSSDRNPRVVVDPEFFLLFGDLDKLSQVSESLFWVQKCHIFNREWVFAKGERISIETMLQYKNYSLSLLCQDFNPSSSLRNSSANPLSTDVQVYRPNFLVPMLIVDPVSLFPVSGLGGIIVVMIGDLVKPKLFLLQAFQGSFSEDPIVCRIVNG